LVLQHENSSNPGGDNGAISDLLSRDRHDFEESADNFIGVDAFGFSPEVQSEAVPETRESDFFHVVDGNVEAAVHCGAGTGGGEKVYAASSADAPGNIFSNKRRSALSAGPAGSDNGIHVTDDMLADNDTADGFLHTQYVVTGENGVETHRTAAHVEAVDFLLFIGAGVVHVDREKEAVELGFRERISAFMLNGVLGSHDEERIGKRIGFIADGNLMFLHCFEKRGLGLGRSTVDFICEDDIRENGAGDECKFMAARCIGAQDVGAGDVRGHKVGRELNALELEVEHVGNGLDDGCFSEAGHADEQAVSAGKEADKDFVNDIPLADDGLGDFIDDKLILAAEGVEHFCGVCRERDTLEFFARGGTFFGHRTSLSWSVLGNPVH